MHPADSTIIYKRLRCIWSSMLQMGYQDSLRVYEKRGWVTKIDLQRLVNDIYGEGDYTTVEGEIERLEDSTIVRVSLMPNPILRAVNISGNQVFSSDTLLSIFRPLLNKSLNVKSIIYGIERCIAMYRESRYSIASVLGARFDSLTNVVNIIIDEGVVSQTDIRGTTKTRDWVVRRELPWHYNNLLTGQEIEKAISNLYGTSYFDQVRLSVHHEDDTSRFNIVTVHAH